MSFNYRWKLTDLEAVPKNGLKVFSLFACAGGSSLGYKMTGMDVLGCVEIDPQMMAIYKKNHNPKIAMNIPVQDFLKGSIPPELYKLDILDASPPCSVFSEAGGREKNWGKKKKFREGQEEQILDDLFFHTIDIAHKLQPKVCIFENVRGLVFGNAKGYVKQIVDLSRTAGYDVQIFYFNAASMGVPQIRERVFFVLRRKDLGLPPLKVAFNEPPVALRDAFKGLVGKGPQLSPLSTERWKAMKEGRGGRDVGIYNTFKKLHWGRPSYTLTGNARLLWHPSEPRNLSVQEMCVISTFPLDFDFPNYNLAGYVMGMSVPPLMMHKVAGLVKSQWLKS